MVVPCKGTHFNGSHELLTERQGFKVGLDVAFTAVCDTETVYLPKQGNYELLDRILHEFGVDTVKGMSSRIGMKLAMAVNYLRSYLPLSGSSIYEVAGINEDRIYFGILFYFFQCFNFF